MQNSKKQESSLSEFRITTWPGQTVRLPDIQVRHARLEEEGRFIVLEAFEKLVELPDELYLRDLQSLDLTNPEGILGFTRNYGCLSAVFSVVGQNLSQGLSHEFYAEAKGKEAKKLGTRPERILFLDELVLHAQLLRDMRRAWEVHSNQRTLDEFNRELESPWLGPFRSEGDVVIGLLALYLNQALQAFHRRVEISFGSHAVQFGEPMMVGTFEALCLQLSNHIAESAIYKKCANETCPDLFVRQRGRAEYGQFKTGGVSYCSAKCCKTQAQRNLRSRQKEARQLHDGGMDIQAIAQHLDAELKTVNGWILGRRRDV